MVNTTLPKETCSVAVIGGGTSGLALAAELMRLQVGKVVVLERESEGGGIPRHCGHYPFGLLEYKRLLLGPDYARRNLKMALDCGVDIRTDTTVTALLPAGAVEVATSQRRYVLKAARVAVCTGVRESSRAQRFISGDRTNGVITTGALQSHVYLQGIRPFSYPVILGSELVSYSAIQTCAHLGIKPIAMLEEQPHTIARSIFQPYLKFKSVSLFTGIQDPRIVGGDTVEAIEFNDANGKFQRIETDGIIVSGRFRPESTLLRESHLEVDANTGGPISDPLKPLRIVGKKLSP